MRPAKRQPGSLRPASQRQLGSRRQARGERRAEGQRVESPEWLREGFVEPAAEPLAAAWQGPTDCRPIH